MEITREAFGEIVRRYQNLVSAVTYSITGNRQESEDLAQETFIMAWKDMEKLPCALRLLTFIEPSFVRLGKILRIFPSNLA